ncbi:MAG: hypothetical protein J1G01_06675 [Clostridiales bacterium]|nr:hypothetical protein [Clostridiales bacterium]
MDSTVPRSTIPVAVIIASEQEPVKCDGVYAEHAGGFALEFSIHQDKFAIEHTAAKTKICTSGELSYDIELSDKVSSVLLATPFGKARFTVKTLDRTVQKSDDKLDISLRYILSSEAAGDIERFVDVTVLLPKKEV